MSLYPFVHLKPEARTHAPASTPYDEKLELEIYRRFFAENPAWISQAYHIRGFSEFHVTLAHTLSEEFKDSGIFPAAEIGSRSQKLVPQNSSHCTAVATKVLVRRMREQMKDPSKRNAYKSIPKSRLIALWNKRHGIVSQDPKRNPNEKKDLKRALADKRTMAMETRLIRHFVFEEIQGYTSNLERACGGPDSKGAKEFYDEILPMGPPPKEGERSTQSALHNLVIQCCFLWLRQDALDQLTYGCYQGLRAFPAICGRHPFLDFLYPPPIDLEEQPHTGVYGGDYLIMGDNYVIESFLVPADCSQDALESIASGSECDYELEV